MYDEPGRVNALRNHLWWSKSATADWSPAKFVTCSLLERNLQGRAAILTPIAWRSKELLNRTAFQERREGRVK